MGDKEKTDLYWKTFLSKAAYQTLRQGVIEEPHTGKYVQTNKVGTYLCAGCASPLFDSQDKMDDGSGYASFKNPITEQAIQLASTYTERGDTETKIICTGCGGRLGTLSGDSVRSDEDLAQGTTQHTYLVSSNAVRLKKAITPSNYPIATLLVVVALGAGGFFTWSWGQELMKTAQLGNTADVIPLWVDDTEVQAKVVRLDSIEEMGTSLVSGKTVLLVDVGGIEGRPRIRFANQPMDILWLDANFVVVGAQQDRPAEERQLDIPASARYMLVVQQGYLLDRAFNVGLEVVVTDKSALF